MASQKDLELLDDYVGNRLKAQDKIDFEKKLESDASLKNEYQLQQKIVNQLRQARISELKTMFNNVPAAALESGGSSVVTQVVLWVAVVGVLGTGIFLYLNNDDKTEIQSVAKQDEIKQEAPAEIKPEQSPAQDKATPAEDKNASPTKDNTVKEAEETVAPQKPETENSAEAEKPAALDIFDPTTEAESSSAEKSEDRNSQTLTSSKSSIVVAIENTDKRYNFHYQFKDSKLHLYGTFEKNLYEIMEFFSDNKRTVFLFYKDSYYLLNEEDEKIKPLAPINDPTLIKKLKDYRGSR
jgi:hypothetical protein